MKKTTSIPKVFAVSVLLLISTALFSQQQVIQNLTVVDSLVISSLQNSSLVATNVTTPPYRYLVIDPHGNVKASNNIIAIPEPGGMSFDTCGTESVPRWKSKPLTLYTCPPETKVGIGTLFPVNKLDVIGSGYFSGNLGVGTLYPQAKLEISGSATPGIFLTSTNYPLTYRTQLGTHANAQGVLVLGNNGVNEIRFGNSTAGGMGYIYVNNTADYSSAANGILAMTFRSDGNVGIGCTSAQYKLQVNGAVKATQFRATATGCDFVFEDSYKLPSIAERKAFIKEYKHLPNIKPAKDMQENGMDITVTAEGLLQNMEEITLYQITHDEKIEMLLKQQEELKIENQKLKEEIRIIKDAIINK